MDDPWVPLDPTRPIAEALTRLAERGWVLAPPRWQPGGGIHALRGHINSEAAILLVRERGWGARKHVTWIWGVQEPASEVTDARFRALIDPGRDGGLDPANTIPDWARRNDRDKAWRTTAREAAWWRPSAQHATLLAILPAFTPVNRGRAHWYVGLSLAPTREQPWPIWETTLWPALWAKAPETASPADGTTTAQITALMEIWDAIAARLDP
jgi:hypothetical protein